MSFTIENEKQNRKSFLDAQIIRADNKFANFVYRKPTFSAVYTHFESSLPSAYKFRTVYTLAWSFQIYSGWTKLHIKLLFLKQTFLKNDYPEIFINKCFKRFMDDIRVVEPYLASISLQIGTYLKKSLKKHALIDVNCK